MIFDSRVLQGEQFSDRIRSAEDICSESMLQNVRAAAAKTKLYGRIRLKIPNFICISTEPLGHHTTRTLRAILVRQVRFHQ